MASQSASVLFLVSAAWASLGIVLGCRAPTKQPPNLAAPPSSSDSSAVVGTTAISTRSSPFPRPELDLPADRLHEHVDGAEPALQALGCRRLLFWRLSNPTTELEIFVFNTESGARSALDKDSGSARTNNVPGDEGWTNRQVVYFRRGTVYCRLIADQPAPVAGLSELATRVEKALTSGEIRP